MSLTKQQMDYIISKDENIINKINRMYPTVIVDYREGEQPLLAIDNPMMEFNSQKRCYIHLHVKYNHMGYNVNIYDSNKVLLYLNIILDSIDVDLTNGEIDKIKKENGLCIDLLSLTTQHKEIYERSNGIVYDSFVEQAGTYEGVIKSYDYYTKIVNERVNIPIKKIEDNNIKIMSKYDKKYIQDITLEIYY